jgi:hypothetical protein
MAIGRTWDNRNKFCEILLLDRAQLVWLSYPEARQSLHVSFCKAREDGSRVL